MVKKELQYDIDAFLQYYTFLQGESSDLTFVEGHRLRLDYLRPVMAWARLFQKSPGQA